MSVLARMNSKFYHGIQTEYTDNAVAVFFKKPSPQFFQRYDKQNINQIVGNTPANISQLTPGARVLIELTPDFAVLGTVMDYYANSNGSNRIVNDSNNEKKNNSTATINNTSNNNTNSLLWNMTVRLDESGHNLSVANKIVWLLPVQMEDKGCYDHLISAIKEKGNFYFNSFFQ